jgi:hypothetical protein
MDKKHFNYLLDEQLVITELLDTTELGTMTVLERRCHLRRLRTIAHELRYLVEPRGRSFH